MIEKIYKYIDNCTNFRGYVDMKVFIPNDYYVSPLHLVEKKNKKVSIFN